MDAAGAGPVADVRSGDVGTRSLQVPDTPQRYVEKELVSADDHKDSDVSGAEWNHSSESLPDLQVASGLQRGKLPHCGPSVL